jgi:hypothetical protein
MAESKDSTLKQGSEDKQQPATVGGRVTSAVKRLAAQLTSQDPTLPCCFGGLILGAIRPVKEVLLPGGTLSWLSGAVVATGAMSPAMSIFIIGGLVWNTRKAALQRQQKAAPSTKPNERQRSKTAPASTSGTSIPASPEGTDASVVGVSRRRRSVVQMVATEIAGEKEAGSSAELEQMRKERQVAATALWTSAFGDGADDGGSPPMAHTVVCTQCLVHSPLQSCTLLTVWRVRCVVQAESRRRRSYCRAVST